MKTKNLAATFAIALLFSFLGGLMLIETAVANNAASWFPQEHYPVITINNDGTISPQTGLISRNGSTYTLTGNVTNYRIFIECSDVVFDGDGYTVSLWNETATAIYVGTDPGEIRNVTVKDVEVLCSESIAVFYCSYCQITGVKVNNYIDVGMSDHINISQCVGPIKLGWGSEYIQVFRNNITIVAVFSHTESNVFYENNFLRDDYNPNLGADSFWDNGSVGNYWVGYNGTDANGDGIGDTPYALDSGNIDNHPIMYPYGIENDTLTLPTREPTLFSNTLIAGISVVSIVVAVAGLLYYQKKKNRRAEKSDENS